MRDTFRETWKHWCRKSCKKKKNTHELFFIRIISDTLFYNATYLNIFLFILFSTYKISFVSYIHTFIYYFFTRFFFYYPLTNEIKVRQCIKCVFWIYIIMDKKESTGASFNKRKFVTICLNSSIINLLLFFFFHCSKRILVLIKVQLPAQR